MNDNRPVPREVALGAATGLVGLVFLIGALAITPDPSAFKVLGPRVAPLTIGIAAVVLSVALVVRGLRPRPRTEVSLTPPDEAGPGASSASPADEEPLDRRARSPWSPRSTRGRLAVTFAMLTGYILLFIPLGYVVSTFLFLTALTTYAEPRKLLRNSIFAAVFAAVVYLLFTRGLQVQLPPGLLG